MSILDPILLAFLAGMAVRDLWPLWIRRTAVSKRFGASNGGARAGGRGGSIRRDDAGWEIVEHHVIDVVELKSGPWPGGSLVADCPLPARRARRENR
jgi:hypothetical protein